MLLCSGTRSTSHLSRPSDPHLARGFALSKLFRLQSIHVNLASIGCQQDASSMRLVLHICAMQHQHHLFDSFKTWGSTTPNKPGKLLYEQSWSYLLPKDLSSLGCHSSTQLFQLADLQPEELCQCPSVEPSFQGKPKTRSRMGELCIGSVLSQQAPQVSS